jgi:DNA-binding phage protein
MTSRNVKIPTNRSYHSYLIESLKDSREAAAYLDAVLEECNYDELSLALRNVAEARLAVLKDSPSSHSREVAQNMLSSSTSLDLFSLFQALNDLGFKLSVVPSII